MTSRSIVSPEDQSATFIELFFDLVFVFSVTQVVGLFHHGVHGYVVGQAILVFWLVWWACSQFTWALNAADTTHTLVELGTLLATAVAFFMAVAVPNAFHESAALFAVTYVLVRVIGLALYAWVASADPAQHAAVRVFAAVSLGGLVAVLTGGIFGGPAQYWLWGLAIILDIVAAAIGGQLEGWNLHPEHFGERHGLFVIIALGETLIVAAGGMRGALWTDDLVSVGVLVVGIACAFWWSYFTRAKPTLDRALESSCDADRASMARDVYSLLHFPMLCGVIAFAVTAEEAIAHPGEPLTVSGRIALALALILFVGGMAFAVLRATGRLPLPRLLISAGAAVAIVAMTGFVAPVSLAIAFLSVVCVAIWEHRQQHQSSSTMAS